VINLDEKLAAEFKADEPAREKQGHFRFITKDETPRMLQLAQDGTLQKATKLVIYKTQNCDLSWISECKDLEELDVSASSTVPVDLSGLKKLVKAEMSAAFQKAAYGLGQQEPVYSLILRSPTPEGLATLGSGVKRLVVSGSPTEWPTFDDSKNLIKLKIVFCKKGPLNISNVASLRNLQSLSLDNLSKGLVGCESLGNLRQLEELFFWDARPIDSLDWIKQLSKLKRFAAWGRTDLDNNIIEYLDGKGMGDGIALWTRKGARM
jgi:Leucine-rich repeat (LRR) protein